MFKKDVERAEIFKYVGAVFDNKLTWKQNTDSIHLYCLQYTTPIIVIMWPAETEVLVSQLCLMCGST